MNFIETLTRTSHLKQIYISQGKERIELVKIVEDAPLGIRNLYLININSDDDIELKYLDVEYSLEEDDLTINRDSINILDLSIGLGVEKSIKINFNLKDTGSHLSRLTAHRSNDHGMEDHLELDL